MRLKARKKCAKCEKTLFTYWHSNENGDKICGRCYDNKPTPEVDQEIPISLHCEEKLPDEMSDSEKNPDKDGIIKNEIHFNKSEEIIFSVPMELARRAKAWNMAKSRTAVTAITSKAAGTAEPNSTNAENLFIAMPTPLKRLRKSTRAVRSKTTKALQRAANTAGRACRTVKKMRNRRLIMKRIPEKPVLAKPKTRFCEKVAYDGSYVQIGDIVSVVDKAGDIYYAQVRYIIVNEFEEKFAVLTWLLPTQESPPPNECFHPATYIIGPDEDFPRKLSTLKFIMHAPSDYYFDRTTPFPVPDNLQCPSRNKGYTWTRLPIHKVGSDDNNDNVHNNSTDATVSLNC